jgi:class 3 adenylate cyclase
MAISHTRPFDDPWLSVASHESVACPTCGTPSASSARFCASCGARIPGAFAVPARPIAVPSKEVRPLSVMFCDLVGSSTLGAELDPEDFTDLISWFFRNVLDAVAAHGGFIGRMLGDGALVYFGYPSAQEDDTDRAVRAALDIVSAFSTKAFEGRQLQVRVGVSSGLVIVGDVAGTGDPRNLDVSGETPNLAARLQAMAEPNTVLVSDSVRRLVGGRFEFRDLGGKMIKGWWEPI